MLEVCVVSDKEGLALSLPTNSGFKSGQRWLLIPSDNGETFMLVPRLANPYVQNETPAQAMVEEWPDVDWGQASAEGWSNE